MNLVLVNIIHLNNKVARMQQQVFETVLEVNPLMAT